MKQSSSASPQRYHPALVGLHWLVLLLIVGTVLSLAGSEGEGRGGGSLLPHMVLGTLVLVLLAVRLLVRWRTQKPAWLSSGSALLDVVGHLTHFGLYFFAFTMTLSGLGVVFLGGGRGEMEGGGGFVLPLLHGLSWLILMLLMALHSGAALYHQFVLNDEVFSRMWFEN